MIFAWITKDTYDISLLAYLDYSKELTKEEQNYLDEVGELTYGAATFEAPLSYEENGEARGIIVDYMECLSTTLGIKIKNVPIEKDEALQLIIDDEVDISNIAPTKKKNQKLNFSQSIYYLKGIVAVKADNTEIKIIEDLNETSVIYRKEMLFNEDGYVTKFDFIFFKHEDIWRYDQITYMHREKAPDIQYMGIIIQKDMAFKRAVVFKLDVEPILELAKSKNPKIYIGDIED